MVVGWAMAAGGGVAGRPGSTQAAGWMELLSICRGDLPLTLALFSLCFSGASRRHARCDERCCRSSGGPLGGRAAPSSNRASATMRERAQRYSAFPRARFSAATKRHLLIFRANATRARRLRPLHAPAARFPRARRSRPTSRTQTHSTRSIRSKRCAPKRSVACRRISPTVRHKSSYNESLTASFAPM